MVVGFPEPGRHGGGYLAGGADVTVGLGTVGVSRLACLLRDDHEREYEVERLEL